MERNIAVVGCGYWGKNLVRNFAQLGALHTICDSDVHKIGELKSLYPGVNAETDYRRLLENEEIKGLLVATLAALHYFMAREALIAGKDVFVEKPFTTSSKDAHDLIEVSDKRQRVLMVGHFSFIIQRYKC